MNRPGPDSLMGYHVCVVKPFPRMQLATNVPVTAEFRAEINAWMAGFFGYDCLLKSGQTMVSELNKTIYVTQEDYNKLRSVA
jgi:hypothetical protein